jgi:hypothetical protein
MKRDIAARAFPCPVVNFTFALSAFRKSTQALLTASLIAGLAGCGGSSKPGPTPTPLPDGNYVYSLAGLGKGDVAGNNIAHPLYFVAGVFTVNGGVISAGEQDITDAATNDFDQINPTGSTIAKTSDGNFQITLTTCEGTSCVSADQRVGVSGVETLDCSFLTSNPGKAYIAEFDANFTGSGTLELQSAASATPSGGYAFNLYGLDKVGNPVTIGGVVNVAAGKINTRGSIFDLNDIGVSPYIFALESFAESSVSSPDNFGRITFTLNPQTTFSPITLVGYIVDASHIRLVETDDTYDGSLGGAALSQGANVTTFSTASVSGNSYVVGLTGFEHANNVGALQVAGVFTFNADGSVTGFLNHNDSTGSGVQAPVSITGTYTVDSLSSSAPDAGTGRVTVMIPSPLLTLELYLDGSGHALAATMDSTDALGGLGFQQSGSSFSTSSFNGSTVLSATGWDKTEAGEFDGVGPITESGSAGTFSGTADLNWLNSAGPTYPDLSVSGTVTTTNGAAANGVFTGTITGLDLTTKTNSDAFSFYLIDSSGDFIAIETDPNQLTLGYFNQQ